MIDQALSETPCLRSLRMTERHPLYQAYYKLEVILMNMAFFKALVAAGVTNDKAISVAQLIDYQKDICDINQKLSKFVDDIMFLIIMMVLIS